MVKPINKTGRPRTDIDKDQFEKLCGLHCTLGEIAAWFRCSEDTVERWAKRTYKMSFADIYRQKRSIGAISLRRKMFETAMNGNIVLMIWLSKQYLGMYEKSKLSIADVSDDVIAEDLARRMGNGSTDKKDV